MKTGVTVTNDQGMTVEDLRVFLSRCEQAEVPPEAVPVVRVSFGGKLKRMEVQG